MGCVRDSRIIPGSSGGGCVRNSAKACGILQPLCCFPGVHIMPSSHLQPHYPCSNPNGGRKTPFLQSCSPPSVYPNKGIYRVAPPELFLGMLWHFPCSVVLPALEGTEQLECSGGMGGSEEKSFPRTCLEVVVVGGRKSGWILTAPAPAIG